ncbi:hypothetical protein EON63_11350, partial [archaeon]
MENSEEKKREEAYHKLKQKAERPTKQDLEDLRERTRSDSLSNQYGSKGSKPHGHDPEAVDRLYKSHIRHAEHRRQLQRRFEQEKVEQIIQSDFRYQLSLSPSHWAAHRAPMAAARRDGDYFDSMYADHIHWDSERRKSIENKRASLAEQRARQEAEACRPVPKIFSSKTMQLPPSPSATAVYEGLYA